MKFSLHRAQSAILLSLAVLCFFAWYAALSASSEKDLIVTFLNVGQGDSILIEAPGGNRLLIDAGNTDGAALRELGKTLPFFERDIDIIVATHPDQDHIGGFPELFERYDISALVEPGMFAGNGVYEATEQAAFDEGAKKIIARRGMKIRLSKNAILEALAPYKNFPPGADPNAASVVLRLSYGKISFLLTGDLPEEGEEELVRAYGQSLDSDVLKLGHHGSKTSSSAVFLAAASPEYAIVSAGAGNTYGHPNKETLDRTAVSGAKILRTDTEGTITFKTDGLTLSYSTDK